MPVSTISQAGLDAPISLTSPTLTTPNIDSAQIATVSGTAPLYMCRAWVNFNGTVATPSTIRGSGNVTSITKNSTGNYTMNLTTALPDTNYAPVCSGSRSSIYLGYGVLKGRPSSTSACNIYFYVEDTYSGESATDGDILCVSIFR